jgi:hypothetical protein
VPRLAGSDRSCCGVRAAFAAFFAAHRSAPSGDLLSIRTMRTMLLAIIVSLKCRSTRLRGRPASGTVGADADHETRTGGYMAAISSPETTKPIRDEWAKSLIFLVAWGGIEGLAAGRANSQVSVLE